MNAKNADILENVAGLLSELNVHDEDLQRLYSLVVEILDFQKLGEFPNDVSTNETFQRSGALLTKFLEVLQNLALETFRGGFEKKPDGRG